MSQDRYTEVTHQSWFSRIGGALKGILFGLLLFVLAFPLLFWNEGRAVKRAKSLTEGSKVVLSVPADSVDPANEGQLIHVSGTATTDAVLTDPVFEVSENALKLKRTVEMYQWKESKETETRTKVGGGEETVTTYSYSKTWSQSHINSENFTKPAGHQNPGSMPYDSTVLTAEEITLGAFTLSPSLAGKISQYEPLPVEADQPLPQPVRDSGQVHNGGYYLGKDPADPQVGDVRIQFQVTRPTPVSVIARQVGSTFEPYRAKAGGEVELLQTGIHSADSMFEQAQQANRVVTWLVRLGGFLLMMFGLNLMTRVFSVLADVIPFFGRIVGAGTRLIAFLLAAVFSLITIAVAWVFYRPLLGILLLTAAGGLIAAVVIKLRSSKVEKASAPLD